MTCLLTVVNGVVPGWHHCQRAALNQATKRCSAHTMVKCPFNHRSLVHWRPVLFLSWAPVTGWRFNGQGRPVSIPQAHADNPQVEATALASSRACVKTYPAQVSVVQWHTPHMR